MGWEFNLWFFQGWKFKLKDEEYVTREFIGQFGYFKIRMSPSQLQLPPWPAWTPPWSSGYLELLSSLLQQAVGYFFLFHSCPSNQTPSKSQKDAPSVTQIQSLTTSTRKPQDLLNSAQSNPWGPCMSAWLWNISPWSSPITNSHTDFLICMHLGSSSLHDQFLFVL